MEIIGKELTKLGVQLFGRINIIWMGNLLPVKESQSVLGWIILEFTHT